MSQRVIALIGHSGAGKSSCLADLEISDRADMDAVLGTKQPPSLDEALEWLTNPGHDLSIVVVSNHEQTLVAMQIAKRTGTHPQAFGKVYFVYLQKSKVVLREHLSKPNASGIARPQNDQDYTLKTYDDFDAMFRALANKTIDCSALGRAEVAEEVKRTLESLREGNDSQS
jgi:hypothetical protein